MSNPQRYSPPHSPSPKFLFNQSANFFLLRQHASALSVLSTLFSSLPPPSQPWHALVTSSPHAPLSSFSSPSSPTSSSLTTPTKQHVPTSKEWERSELRRKATSLYVTVVVCSYNERVREGDDAAAMVKTGGPCEPELEALFARRDGRELWAFLVDFCERVYAPASSSASSAASSGQKEVTTGTSSTTTVALNPPPPVVLTLIHAASSLSSSSTSSSASSSIPPSLIQQILIDPFLSSIPCILHAQLASLARARESAEGQLEKTRGGEGVLGQVLDGYEGLIEGWTGVLASGEGKEKGTRGERQARELIGRDGILNVSQKTRLFHTLDRIPPRPSSVSIIASSPQHQRTNLNLPSSNGPNDRPPSPALSSSSSSSASTLGTATPTNYRRSTPLPRSSKPSSDVVQQEHLAIPASSASSTSSFSEYASARQDPFQDHLLHPSPAAPPTTASTVASLRSSSSTFGSTISLLCRFLAPRSSSSTSPSDATTSSSSSSPSSSQRQHQQPSFLLRFLSNRRYSLTFLLFLLLGILLRSRRRLLSVSPSWPSISLVFGRKAIGAAASSGAVASGLATDAGKVSLSQAVGTAADMVSGGSERRAELRRKLARGFWGRL